MLNFFKNNTYTAPALIIAISMLLVTILVTGSAKTFATKSDTITVTGSAERLVKSDTVKWTITANARVDNTVSGTSEMKNAEAQIVKFLKSNNITEANIKINNLSNNQICNIGAQGYENCSLGVSGYNFYQSIVVEIDDVDLVSKLSKEINSKLQLININSGVEYYYNNLKNIRAEMLSEATKNALERANSVAAAGGANIGKITSLSSGVFQVTPKNSVNFDDYGSYDTTEIDKKITATVKANFSVK
jgi:uncharacterized protein